MMIRDSHISVRDVRNSAFGTDQTRKHWAELAPLRRHIRRGRPGFPGRSTFPRAGSAGGEIMGS